MEETGQKFENSSNRVKAMRVRETRLYNVIQEMEIVEIVCGSDILKCETVNLKILKPTLKVVKVRKIEGNLFHRNR